MRITWRSSLQNKRKRLPTELGIDHVDLSFVCIIFVCPAYQLVVDVRVLREVGVCELFESSFVTPFGQVCNFYGANQVLVKCGFPIMQENCKTLEAKKITGHTHTLPM